MSDKTKEAMEEAIRAHFADEQDGAMMVNYVIQMAGIVPNNSDIIAYLRESPDDQAMHVTLGLIDYVGWQYKLAREASGD